MPSQFQRAATKVTTNTADKLHDIKVAPDVGDLDFDFNLPAGFSDAGSGAFVPEGGPTAPKPAPKPATKPGVTRQAEKPEQIEAAPKPAETISGFIPEKQVDNKANPNAVSDDTVVVAPKVAQVAPAAPTIADAPKGEPAVTAAPESGDLLTYSAPEAEFMAEPVVGDEPVAEPIVDAPTQPAPERTPIAPDIEAEVNPEPAKPSWLSKKLAREKRQKNDRRKVEIAADAVDQNSGSWGDPFKRLTPTALRDLKDNVVKSAKAMWRGSAISREITGDPRLSWADVSLPVSMMVYQLRNEPDSYLAEIIQQYNPGIDMSEMLRSDNAAEGIIISTFEKNYIYGLVEKTVHDETTTHNRRIRVHRGTSVKINPIMAKQFNADFDGDKLKVSYRPEMVKMGMSPMSYLLGTEGGVRIDADFYQLLPLYGDIDKSMDDVMAMIDGLVFNDRHKQMIKDGYLKAWGGDVNGGLKEVLYAISEASYNMYGDTPQAHDVAGAAIEAIYKMNEKIIAVSKLVKRVEDSRLRLEEATRKYAESGVTAGGFQEVYAEPAPNSMSAQDTINAPSGMSGGRNMQFRITAGLGKLARLSRNILGQDNIITRRTFLFILTLQMSNLQDFESASSDMGRIVDEWIFNAVPDFPTDYKDTRAYSAFMKSFIRAYNNAATIVNAGGAKQSTAGTYEKSDDFYMKPILTPSDLGYKFFDDIPMTDEGRKDRGAITDSIRKAFRSTYGGFKMGQIFGNNPMIEEYAELTLDDFIYENDFTEKETGFGSSNFFSDPDLFIARLADLNTSFAQKIYDQTDAAVKAQFVGGKGRGKNVGPGEEIEYGQPKLGYLISRLTDANKNFLIEDLYLLTESLRDLWPEMFDFLGLNNPYEYMNTDPSVRTLGQKFREANTFAKFKGVLMEAVARYRFDPIFKAEARLVKAREAGDSEAEAEALAERDSQLDALRDVGVTWEVIVDQYREDPTTLDKVFFSDYDADQISRYIVRMVTERVYRARYSPQQVMADLFSTPKNPGSDDRFSFSKGHNQLLKNLKSSVRRSQTYDEQNHRELQKQVAAAKKVHGDQIVAFFTAMANDSSAFIDFSELTIVEAVTAIMEKTYAQTEKAQQSKVARYLYSAVSYLKNGGVLSHMVFGGDLSVGEMSLAKFKQSPHMLAKILTDPNFTLRVYDDRGYVAVMSMETILGTSTPGRDHAAHIWEWMTANPRAAAALRVSGTAAGIGESGSEYTVATMNLSESIGYVLANSGNTDDYAEALAKNPLKKRRDESRRAMLALSNRPGFYALVSLTVPMKTERRQQARGYAVEWKNISRVTTLIRQYYDSNGIVDEPAIERDVEQLFISQYGQEDVDMMNEMFEKEKARREEAKLNGEKEITEREDVSNDPLYQLAQIKADMIGNMKRYAADLVKANDKTKLSKDSVGLIPSMAYEGMARLDDMKSLFLLGDSATMRSYFNVAETISNVKTELDTGVNGAESRRYAALMFLADLIAEPCDAPEATEQISIEELGRDWHKYTDRVARIGEDTWVPIGSETFEHIAELASKNGNVVLLEDPGRCTASCPCSRHSTADQSTKFGKRQTPPLVRMLTIVRTLSAEGLNLKSKTKGIDELDSIIKNELDNPLFKEVSVQVRELIESRFVEVLAETGDESMALKEARLILAEHLDKVFKSMKYENSEMRINDFINIAHVMIKTVNPGTPEATVVIMSIGRINAIVDTALAKMRTISRAEGIELDTDDYIKVAEQALEAFDPTIATIKPESVMYRMKVPRMNKHAIGKVRSDWNNSTSRRTAFLSEMFRRIDGVYQLASERQLNDQEAIWMNDAMDGMGDVNVLELIDRWEYYAHRGTKYIKETKARILRDPADRTGLRLVGVLPEGDKNATMLSALGDLNVVIVSAKSPKVVEAMATAYHLGNTVILDGKLTQAQWDLIGKKTNGGLDRHQGSYIESTVDTPLGETVHVGRYFSMLDIQMNGKNTTARKGGHDIGVFKANGEADIRFIAESIVNPHRANDGEFIATLMAKMIKHKRDGEYVVTADQLFANTKEVLDSPELVGEYVEQTGSTAIGIGGTRHLTNYEAFRAFMEDSNVYMNGQIGMIYVTDESPRTELYARRWGEAIGVDVEVVKAAWDGDWKTAKKERDEEMVAMCDQVFTFVKFNSGDDFDNGNNIYNAATRLAKPRIRVAINQDPQTKRFGEATFVAGDGRTGKKAYDHFFNPEENPVKKLGVPQAKLVTGADVKSVIIPAIREGNWGDVNLDVGTPDIELNKAEEQRMKEQLVRYADQVEKGNIDDRGWVKYAQAGEIVGIVKIETRLGTIYHPVRVFEHENASGAPTDMEIKAISFREATGEIVVEWRHEGNMLGRFFKVFEDGNASVKLMARPEHIDDIIMEDGTKLFGYISRMSTATRRLEWRRQQKLLTLLYKARLQPFGYNIVESGGLFNPEDAELANMVRTGEGSDIAIWAARLKQGPIEFFGDPQIDKMLNYMANRCVMFGVDPTVLFASHHYMQTTTQSGDGTSVEEVFAPNDMWFNFQVVLGMDSLSTSQEFMSTFMRFMHIMNEGLCPDGIDGDSSGTLFNNDLQMFMPIEERDGETYGEWVDVFGGFHFLDDHFYGYSASGTRVSSVAIASLPALMASGAKLTVALLEKYLDWGNIGVANRRDFMSGISSYDDELDD